ncbi:hypothetical protein QFC20_007059 [Naganishia adeliensis]|uniref:Uncharacterized protein n=1 Tax=Naganishia adeliensis TaxID=92952 RepID=A0ACC2V599_9TREE|nr:hypothetical protein QFC20_007059 [Naganishia adeliensis]
MSRSSISTFPPPTQLVPQPEAVPDCNRKRLVPIDWELACRDEMYPSFNSTWGINLRELNVTETVVQVVQLVCHPSFHTGPTSQAEGAGFEYVIGGTNISLHGVPGVSDSAEASIWIEDYALQAATLNVKETRAPHIQGAYYGALMANEFIGYGDNVHVAELPMFNTLIAAYGA